MDKIQTLGELIDEAIELSEKLQTMEKRLLEIKKLILNKGTDLAHGIKLNVRADIGKKRTPEARANMSAAQSARRLRDQEKKNTPTHQGE